MVRKERLELSRLTALEPKSSASTNSATFARYISGRDYIIYTRLFAREGGEFLRRQRPAEQKLGTLSQHCPSRVLICDLHYHPPTRLTLYYFLGGLWQLGKSDRLRNLFQQARV